MSVEYYLEYPYYLDLKEQYSFAMQNQSAISNLIANTITLLNQIFAVIGLIAIMFAAFMGISGHFISNCIFNNSNPSQQYGLSTEIFQ